VTITLLTFTLSIGKSRKRCFAPCYRIRPGQGARFLAQTEKRVFVVTGNAWSRWVFSGPDSLTWGFVEGQKLFVRAINVSATNGLLGRYIVGRLRTIGWSRLASFEPSLSPDSRISPDMENPPGELASCNSAFAQPQGFPNNRFLSPVGCIRYRTPD